MKKYFSIIAIALLSIGLIATPAFAAADTVAYGGGTGMGTLRTVTTISGTSTTFDETNVSTTSYVIPSKCIILGYDVQIAQVNSVDGRVAIIDASSTSAGDKDTQILSESEATNAYPVSIMFPQGIRISRGLTIKQGPYTVVTVYYIQDRP